LVSFWGKKALGLLLIVVRDLGDRFGRGRGISWGGGGVTGMQVVWVWGGVMEWMGRDEVW